MSCCRTLFQICNGIPNCLTSLVLITPIISASATIRIVDRFNKVFYVTKTTGSDGAFTINLLTDLPVGLFSPFSTYFRVCFTNDIQWTIGGDKYDDIVFNVSDTIGASPTYTLNPNNEDGLPGDFNGDFNNDFFI